MREGLRSGKVNVKVGVNNREGREDSRLGSVSGSGGEKVDPGTVTESPDLQIGKKNGELDNEGFEEGGGGDEGGSGNVGVADNERKRKRADGGEGIANGDIGDKKVKDEVEDVNYKPQVCRRVLRSSVAVNGGCDKAGSKDDLNQNSSDDDGFEEKLLEERKEKCDVLVNYPARKLKGKRGRPPLVKEVESDANGLKVKRGRPCKVEKEEHSSLVFDGGLRKRLKGKRGRPRKEQGGSGALARKRGRPPKVQNRNGAKLGRSCKVEKQEHNPLESGGPWNKKLRPKHGRPVKVQESNEVLKEDDGKEGEESVEDDDYNPLESDGGLKKKFKCKHGRPATMRGSNGALKGEVGKEGEGIARNNRILEWQDRTKQSLPSYISYHERVLIEKELNMRGLSSRQKRKNGTDLETKENDGTAGKISQTIFAVSLENQRAIRKGKITKKDGDVKPGKRSANQSVREKIIEILLTAGWTIQRRPRAGREYLDAVYADPGGHTHWSVTKAYNSLKEHYEAGEGESKVYKTGFKFFPIPEEELGRLKRVIIKKRKGKKLKSTEGNANDNGVTSKKKHKKKLVGKSQRGRIKGKSLLPEHKNLAYTKRKGIPIFIRDPKQQNKRNGSRPTLLVRNSMEEADSDGDGYIPYAGKRTVLAWMIDLGTVSLNDKVQYMNQRKTRVLREGRITRDGIHCDCCSEILTISEFEIHAGSELCEPFKNIYLESGTSLLQCLLDSWNKQQEPKRDEFHYVDVHGEDPNDDSCGICGDGGDLICCDGCPSTFHQSCMDIQKFPSGDWLCGYCSCKFCWMAGRNECQKDVSDDLAASKLLTCQLCEEKYHLSCSKANNVESVDSDSSFCGEKCQELFKKLKTLLGVKHDLEDGFSWTLIHRAVIDPSASICDIPQKCDVAWEIECNSKLAVALSIMDECFLPIVDQRSGINLIHSIVYNCGSNFNRLNYSGFCTAILERGDEIVCAACIRIHGDLLAEMPFIGTRYMYRRQGMCRRLLSVIESVLCSLGVERLVIPAISELQETWTSVFGFRPLEVSIKQKIKNINMLVFPHIQMLQKPLFKLQAAEENMIIVEGPKSTELEEHQTKEEVSCKIAPQGVVEMKGPVVESGLRLPDASLNNTDGKCLAEFGMARDSLEEEKKSTMDPSDSIHGICEETEVAMECQKACSGLTAPVLDQRAVERSSQADQLSISENDSGSFTLPCSEAEGNGSETLIFCASMEGVESADSEVKVENHIVADNLNSNNEGFIHRSEIKSAKLHKEVLCEFEVPIGNVVSQDSKTTNRVSNSDMDFKCCLSERYMDERMLEIHEVQNNHSAVVQASATLGESTECSVSQNLHTSELTVEEVHQVSTQKTKDDSNDSRTFLPVGSLQCNGLETQEVLSSVPVDSNYNPSCGACIDSNGLCNSKEVISGSLGVVVDSVQD